MKATKKVVVLGGGISGLAVAHALGKKLSVTLIEKKDRVGGWLETKSDASYFFEKGPRTFPASRSLPLLTLVKELKLEDELLPSSLLAKKRYLWHNGKLHGVPGSPLSPIMRPLLAALLFKEWRVSKKMEDETIWEFASRRFNKEVADLLFDPITMGIYGGDAKKLSINSTFPFLKRMEMEHGSLVKGLFRSRSQKKPLPVASLPRRALFSFKEGVSFFAKRLSENIRGDLQLGEEVKELQFHEGGWKVITDKEVYLTDFLVSALPAPQLGRLFQSLNAEIAELLLSIVHQDLTIVNVGYREGVLQSPGFGYLIPSIEREAIGGVIFDSSLFPEHNKHSNQTRMTAIIPGLPQDSEEKTIDSLRKHLGILKEPDFLQVVRAPSAIPQYHIGHQEKIQKMQTLMNKHFPTAFFTGNFVGGVSVSDCISQAQSLVSKLV